MRENGTFAQQIQEMENYASSLSPVLALHIVLNVFYNLLHTEPYIMQLYNKWWKWGLLLAKEKTTDERDFNKPTVWDNRPLKNAEFMMIHGLTTDRCIVYRQHFPCHHHMIRSSWCFHSNPRPIIFLSKYWYTSPFLNAFGLKKSL